MPKRRSSTRRRRDATRETFRYVLDAVARDYALRECEEVIDFLTRADGGGMGREVGDGRMGTEANVRAAKTKASEDDKGKGETKSLARRRRRRRRRYRREMDVGWRVYSRRRCAFMAETTVDRRRPRAGTTTGGDDGVFDETEMTTTTATATATPVPAPSSSMPSMAMSSLGASTTTTYENTNAGARKPVRRNALVALTPSFDPVSSTSTERFIRNDLVAPCLFNRASAVETLLELGGSGATKRAGRDGDGCRAARRAFASRGL